MNNAGDPFLEETTRAATVDLYREEVAQAVKAIDGSTSSPSSRLHTLAAVLRGALEVEGRLLRVRIEVRATKVHEAPKLPL